MGHTDCASTSLAPGFRFHPTDEELVSYYLKRKVCGKPLRFDAIGEVDIYKVEPWDLPGLSKLKSRDLEWYFFSGLDRKYGNGSRTNRATCEGYWKTTGKDRPVHHRSRLVGMKKTLVYHLGRAPHGKRSNWVMHEYRLVDQTLEKTGYSLEGFVLCRIFQKSGVGPKNGEKYGAPLIEEEWENDNVRAVVPGDVCFEKPAFDDDAFIEQNDLEQNLIMQHPSNVPIPINHGHEDGNTYVEDFRDMTGSEEKSLEGEHGYNGVLDDQKFFDLPLQDGSSVDVVKNQHMAQPNDGTNEVSPNCLSNGTSSDTIADAPSDDGLFVDAIDFLDPGDENPLDFGAMEPYLEDDIDIAQYLSFDSPFELMDSDTDQALSTTENLDNATWQLLSPSQQLSEASVDLIASSSEHVMDVPTSKPTKSDMQYPYLGQASRLLGNIPAPPAFASEFPTKDLAARLNAVQSSSSVHVTAGMIRISEITVGGSRLQWSFDKTGNVNVRLSFDLPLDSSQEGLGSLLSSKMAAAFSHGWTRFMVFWVLVFSVGFKIGSCIYVK